MTISSTELTTTQDLQHRIDKLLDFTPKIKIQKLEHGTVKVNDIVIDNHYGSWKCKDECFYRRKSAVGYALCIINNDTTTANNIKSLDTKLQKFKTDLDFYHYHLRRASAQRKITISNRISADMPLLLNTDSQLTQLLKTVSV